MPSDGLTATPFPTGSRCEHLVIDVLERDDLARHRRHEDLLLDLAVGPHVRRSIGDIASRSMSRNAKEEREQEAHCHGNADSDEHAVERHIEFGSGGIDEGRNIEEPKTTLRVTHAAKHAKDGTAHSGRHESEGEGTLERKRNAIDGRLGHAKEARDGSGQSNGLELLSFVRRYTASTTAMVVNGTAAM